MGHAGLRVQNLGVERFFHGAILSRTSPLELVGGAGTDVDASALPDLDRSVAGGERYRTSHIASKLWLANLVASLINAGLWR